MEIQAREHRSPAAIEDFPMMKIISRKSDLAAFSTRAKAQADTGNVLINPGTTTPSRPWLEDPPEGGT